MDWLLFQILGMHCWAKNPQNSCPRGAYILVEIKPVKIDGITKSLLIKLRGVGNAEGCSSAFKQNEFISLRRFEGRKGVLHGAIGRKSIRTEATDRRTALRQEAGGAFGTAKCLVTGTEWARKEKRRGSQEQWVGGNRASRDF